jgi:hypothetical protein
MAMLRRAWSWPVMVTLVLTAIASGCGSPRERAPVLEYELTLVEVGDTHAARLVVRNAGARTARLEFPSSQRYDFVVRQEGREVWRWSDGRAFLTVIVEDSLAPRATQSYAEVLPRLPAGTYRVEAFFLADREAGVVGRRTLTVR